MHIQHIRNATMIIEYGNKKFLVDPFLADKGTYPPFPNSARQDQHNPLEELPLAMDTIIDVDAVIVTHLHLDHWDEKAQEVLPKDIKLFVQNAADQEAIEAAGFTEVEVLTEHTNYEGIQLIKTAGEHDRGPVLELAGLVCGVVFKHEEEKTLYLAGDTVWYDEVQKTIDRHQPEVIVVNAGDNQFVEGGSLVMNDNDVYEVYKAAPPGSQIIAVHMEAVNHWNLSKQDLSKYAHTVGMQDHLWIPENGDKRSF